MSIRKLIIPGLLALSFVAGTATAQDGQLLPTSEFYFDEDTRTSRAIEPVRGSGDALVQALVKATSRNPRALAETAQLAHVAMEGGRPELGRDLYGRVLRQLEPTHSLYRPTHWNFGWDLLRDDDPAGALTQWEALRSSRALNADWMPPTYALVLWRLDRRDEAVQWYAAAVRTHPSRWSTTGQYAELLPAWNDEERATLAQVHAAWAADPPEWR